MTNEYFTPAAEPPSKHLSFLCDIIFLPSMSCIGFLMTGDYRSYWKTDIFTKRLLFLRLLPIDPKQIVAARYVQIGINLVLMSAVFFIPFYFISVLAERLSLLEYLYFITLWLCYGMCMAAVFAYKELGTTGKSYFLFCMLWAAAYIGMALLAWGLGFGFLEMSVKAVETFGPAAPAIGIILVIVWNQWWRKATLRKISRREFTR